MRKVKSDLPLDYVTIKTTKSRIDKGLLAIPVSLIDIFPVKKGKVWITDSLDDFKEKIFTPYSGSSKECRIGGMRSFYQKNNVEDGDEIVIIKNDDSKFFMLPEKDFADQIKNSINDFQNANNENIAEQKLNTIKKLTSISNVELLKNQFVNLSAKKIEERKIKVKPNQKVNEAVPSSVRKILLELYNGKCQVSNFTFFMKNGNPYFEIHHINPELGDHIKNLLVVSPNIHVQFTYAPLEQEFDNDGWLRYVSFNDERYPVFQIIDSLPKGFSKQIHF